MLPNSKVLEQHVVLWAEPQALPDPVQAANDAVAIDHCRARGGGVHSSQNRHGGCFPWVHMIILALCFANQIQTCSIVSK